MQEKKSERDSGDGCGSDADADADDDVVVDNTEVDCVTNADLKAATASVAHGMGLVSADEGVSSITTSTLSTDDERSRVRRPADASTGTAIRRRPERGSSTCCERDGAWT